MTQLHSFSGTPFDVHFPAEIPCPVPDWENGVLRAYSQEEQKQIRNWYVERGLVKPLEEIIGQPKPMTIDKIIHTKERSKILFPTPEDSEQFLVTLEESRQKSYEGERNIE
ncbi:MAG: hypothetical protein LBC20_01075 [Planctomycetaceae bacterium]|jgi:hypothetical protein|nr:hypothetical protein [Planctomycetaceae bacterium]